MTCIDLI